MPQRQRERAVAAHRVAGDAETVTADRERRGHEAEQLVDHVPFHREVRRPRCLRRVDVEARALAEVPARIVGHALAARRGVGRDEREAELGAHALRAGLGGHVVLGAGQARQVQHRGHRARVGRRGGRYTAQRIGVPVAADAWRNTIWAPPKLRTFETISTVMMPLRRSGCPPEGERAPPMRSCVRAHVRTRRPSGSTRPSASGRSPC